MVKHFLLLLFLFSIFPGLFAARIDNDVKKARSADPGTIIKCSSDGRDGSSLPISALAGLKRGSTLFLLSGDYDGEISIPTDRVTIIGSGDGKCNASLKLTGKGCVVKNIWLGTLYAMDDVLVLDSVVEDFYPGYGGGYRQRGEYNVYNSCLNRISCYSGDAKVNIKNCTIVNSWGGSDMAPVSCDSSVRYTIENSILYSPSVVFGFSEYYSRKGKLTLRDCLIFGKSGLGKMNYSSSDRKNKMVAFDLKELRKLGSVSLLGDNMVAQPVFRKDINLTAGGSSRIGGVCLENFLLSPDSPGEDRGVIVAEHPFLKALSAPVKEAAPKNLNDPAPASPRLPRAPAGGVPTLPGQ